MIAQTPSPPYYAVVFTSIRSESDADPNSYAQTAERMVELAAQQPGFLGIESARNPRDGGALGITVSYWENLEAIRNWKHHAEHTLARQQGRSEWYLHYKTRICKVERDYDFEQQVE